MGLLINSYLIRNPPKSPFFKGGLFLLSKVDFSPLKEGLFLLSKGDFSPFKGTFIPSRGLLSLQGDFYPFWKMEASSFSPL
jgi:hypothetical protein